MPDVDTTPYLLADIETSGLEERTDYLLEVGLAVVTHDLDTIVARQSWVWPWSPTLLNPGRDRAHPDVQAMHDRTGLWDDCVAAYRAAATPAAEIAAWVAEHTTPAMPLTGSSVHFDARWLALWVPAVVRDRTYRLVDVSAIREWLARTPVGAPIVAARPPAVKAHRVDPDIDDTLAELRHYWRALGLEGVTPETAVSSAVPEVPKGQTRITMFDDLATAEEFTVKDSRG